MDRGSNKEAGHGGIALVGPIHHRYTQTHGGGCTTARIGRSFMKHHKIVVLIGFIFGGALTAGLAFPTSALADTPFTSSPLGIQKVLVIPLQVGTTNPCPDPTAPCPSQDFINRWGPPRHTASEWENLLNTRATGYWRRATYDQTILQFTVLNSGLLDNGWWPAPHSMQQYANNAGGPGSVNFISVPPNAAYVDDAVKFAIDTLCLDPFVRLGVCQQFLQYNRLVVLLNQHVRSAQTYAGNDYAEGINTVTMGRLVFSQSWALESFDDLDGVSALLHELGHQLGIQTHYGECATTFQPPQTPTTPGLPPNVECVGGWDMMGLDAFYPLLTAYSRINRGWIDPDTTLTIPLRGTASSTSVTLLPVEEPPTPERANVIRLATSDPSNPQFRGYYVECRQRVLGDEGIAEQSGSGITSEGLLITSVHEASLPAVNPVHVVRALSPSDMLNRAPLQPGQTFTDPTLGLSVTFDRYVPSLVIVPGLAPSPPTCAVSVDYAVSSRSHISIWGGDAKAARDTWSKSIDIGLNHRLLIDGEGIRPLPVDPPWTGHDNVIFTRVHNEGTVGVSDVRLDVGVSEPALITDACGGDPTFAPLVGSAILPSVNPGSSIGAVRWTPSAGQAVTIQALAHGPDEPTAGRATTTFAFQFHHAGLLEEAARTLFMVGADAGCPSPRSFVISPAFVPPGWQVQVEPKTVTVGPGQQELVTIVVRPPLSAEAGRSVEIPVGVLGSKKLAALGIDPAVATSMHTDEHPALIGSLTVLARVVGPPSTVSLGYPSVSLANTAFAVSGTISPAGASSSGMIEYLSPSGQKTTHVVRTGPTGFTDSLTPNELGPWTIRARWNGDAAHEPAESAPGTVLVYAPPTGGSFVIGNQSAALGARVTFWGAQWSLANSLSGGQTPANFKGFANNPRTLPSCGGTWSATAGNSSSPPTSIPAYMAVLVASSVVESGSLDSGNVVQEVVVQTNAGYAPDSGHTGTGTVLATICK